MKNNSSMQTSEDGSPMGTIVAFALTTIPPGWLLCDGSAINPMYSNLIAALGSNNTPNLAGRVLIGTGAFNNNVQSDGTVPNFPAQSWQLAYTGGECTHILTVNEMPSHTHGISSAYGWDINELGGSSIHLCTQQSAQTDATGGSQQHNNMQPYFAVNYIIYTGLDS
jgi:microcystin-dependent protein